MTMLLWRVSGECSKMSLSITVAMQPGHEAIREIREYIEIFYNRQRRQARLGYLSPAAYEQKFYAGQIAA